MSQTLRPHRLKRAKAVLPGALKSAEREKPTSIEFTSPLSFRRILRTLLRSPWDDYDYVRQLDQVILAKRKAVYFRVVEIRQFYCDDVLQQAQVLSQIQHPNVVSLYDIYCHDGQFFLIAEHLDVSMSQLDIRKHQLEEWEIATIISEVRTPLTKPLITYIIRFSKALHMSPR
jgi:serine/threonine protein kinase